MPSSGGYGDPLEREPGQVVSDICDGFTTLEQAREDYGVVIDEGSLTVDAAATDELRSKLRSSQEAGAKA